MEFQELGITMGNDYKNYYTSVETSKNSDWSLLEEESVDSKKRQLELEQPDHQSFEDFVKEYFNESSSAT